MPVLSFSHFPLTCLDGSQLDIHLLHFLTIISHFFRVLKSPCLCFIVFLFLPSFLLGRNFTSERWGNECRAWRPKRDSSCKIRFSQKTLFETLDCKKLLHLQDSSMLKNAQQLETSRFPSKKQERNSMDSSRNSDKGMDSLSAYSSFAIWVQHDHTTSKNFYVNVLQERLMYSSSLVLQ